MTVGGESATAERARRPVVAVYREMLLNYNEPFVRGHGESLVRYEAHYVGARRVRGLDLPRERTLVLRDAYAGVDGLIEPLLRRLPARGPLRAVPRYGIVGRASETAFKVLGVSPPLVRGLRAIGPALLHAHTGVSGAQALPLARRLGVPLLVSYHGYETTATESELRRWPTQGRVFLRRREEMKREVARFLVASRYLRDRVLALGYPEERVVTHYLGVDTTAFRADPVVPREPIVLFVGRLREVKGVAHLLDAMAAVQARHPTAELVIAGRGPHREDLERRTRVLGLRARFLGAIEPAEVRAWMNRARVLAVPSVPASTGEDEILSIVALEAQAMELPVVGSRTGGIPEAVADGETGLLAPPGDAPALARQIETLLTDDARWERTSRAARARVVARFDLRRRSAALEALYDEVIEERAARRGARR